MLVRADQGGGIAVPVREFGGTTFEFTHSVRVLEDGTREVSYTLTPLTDEQAKAIRRAEYEQWGPPGECEAIDARISAQKAKEARTAERRAAKAEKAATKPGEPRMRLV